MFKKHYEDIKRSIGVVADDFTGAADTGLQFAKRGLVTLVLSAGVDSKRSTNYFPEGAFEPVPVLVINTGSRGFTAKIAYKAVRDVSKFVKKRKLIYKKVDSTLRGNIGAEIDAVMDITGKELTVFSAAYPKYKRYTIHGIHQLGNISISSTEVSRDPVNPVTDSHIIKIIGKESKKIITVIDYMDVVKGHDILISRITDAKNNGNQIIACDAASEKDLHEIVIAALKIEPLPIFTGSAGMAEALAKILSGTENSRKKIRNGFDPGKSSLIVSGSISEVNEKQLDFLQCFDDVGTFNLSVDSIALREYEQVEWMGQTVESIIELLKNNKITIIRIEGKNFKSELFSKQLSKEIVGTLGLITQLVIMKIQSEIKCIILTGGDTAEAVIAHLGAGGMWIDSEVQAGIPFGFLYKGPYEGFPVITKAGGFGGEDTLRICTEYLM